MDFVVSTNKAAELIDYFKRMGVKKDHIYHDGNGTIALAWQCFDWEPVSEKVFTAIAARIAKETKSMLSFITDKPVELVKPDKRYFHLKGMVVAEKLQIEDPKEISEKKTEAPPAQPPEREKTFYEIPENYIFTEFCYTWENKQKGTSGFTKWEPCALRKSKKHPRILTVSEVRRKYKKKELFFSQFRFADTTGNFNAEKAHRYFKYGEFIMESDNPAAVEFSRKVITFLEDTLHIPPEAISIDCSGGRSIHIGIAPEIFGVTPCANLPEQYEELANLITEATGTIFDLKIYKPRRMFRAYGCFRVKKGTYKTAITKEELFTLSLDDLLEIAKIERPIKHRTSAGIVSEASALFEKAKKQAGKRLKERLENLQDAPVIDIGKLQGQRPPCITQLLQTGCTEGMHYYENFHASYCHAAGMTVEEAFNEIATWQTTCHYDKSPEERSKRLLPNIKSIYKMKFKFYCGYARELKLPCDQSCPLYNKKKGIREIKAETAGNTDLTIEEARTEILEAFNENLKTRDTDKKSLLIKSPPGTGKSTIGNKFYTEKHRNHRNNIFILAQARIDHLKELQDRGELPADTWQIIRGRKQIKEEYKEGEEPGNCYKADEINELCKKRGFYHIPHLCKLGCNYKELCESSPCMYLGQWDTGKNMAMTHEMLLLGGSNIKKVTRVIIDEIPLSSFIEKIEAPAIEITQSVIELERQYMKAPYFYIYKTLHAMAEGLKIAGQTKVLNGSDFLKRFEFDFSRLAPPGKDLDFILSVKPSDIWESKEYYWRQDFCSILQAEIKDWRTHGDSYNSNIYLKYHEKHKNIEFYFLRKRELKEKIKNAGIIALDATTDKSIWEQAAGTQMQEKVINISLPEGSKVIQVYSGRYGKTYHTKNPAIIQKEQAIIDLLRDKAFFGGWNAAKESLTFPDAECFGHFYGTRGTNRFEDYPIACIFGTPNIQPDHFKETVRGFYAGTAPLDFTIEKTPVRYGANIEGKDYETKIPRAIDPRVQAFWEIHRESEILQIAHRIRPLLNPKIIYLITSLPIPGLPPTELLTLTDLLNSLKLNNPTVNINFIPRKKPEVTIESSSTSHDPCTRTFKEVEQQTTIDSETERGTFFEFFEKQLWFFEKWKSLIFTVESALQEAKASHVKKLYNNIYKNLFLIQKFDMATTDIPQGESTGQFSKIPTNLQHYYYKKFIGTLKLTNGKYSINTKKPLPPVNLTIHFKPAQPGEVLPIEVIQAEYEKVLRLKERGQLLKLLPIEEMETYETA